MPAYVKRTGRDVIDDILIRLGELEKRVAKQEGSPKRTSIDRGDMSGIPAPLEGQTLIQYDTEGAHYYSNGMWRDFFTPTTVEVEFLSADNSSVGSGTFGDLSFTHVSGATLLDLTTPTGPVILSDGDYEIAGMLRTADNINTGRMVRGLLLIGTSEQVAAGGTFTADASTAGVAYINISCGLKLSAGDFLELVATNHDSISHHFTVGSSGNQLMAVTKR